MKVRFEIRVTAGYRGDVNVMNVDGDIVGEEISVESSGNRESEGME